MIRERAIIGVAVVVVASLSCSSPEKSLGVIFRGGPRASSQPGDVVTASSKPNETEIEQTKTLHSDSEADASLSSANGRERAALAIFERACFSCHGKEGSNSGNIGSVLNINNLVERNLVKFGSPDQSKLLQRMNDAKQPMPPAGMLQTSDCEIVRQWILGLATPRECH